MARAKVFLRYEADGSSEAAKVETWKEALRPYIRNHRMKEFKLCPEKSALLIIDMQRFFLVPDSHAYVPNATDTIQNVKALADAYREARLPVIYTYHAVLSREESGIMDRWWGDIQREGGEMAKIIPALSPKKSDIVIRKTRYSAFAGTELEKILRDRGVEQVVITGVLTHLCCDTTARAAFMRDFEVYFGIDCTATYNDDLHAGTLRALADGFAMPITCREVLKCLER